MTVARTWDVSGDYQWNVVHNNVCCNYLPLNKNVTSTATAHVSPETVSTTLHRAIGDMSYFGTNYPVVSVTGATMDAWKGSPGLAGGQSDSAIFATGVSYTGYDCLGYQDSYVTGTGEPCQYAAETYVVPLSKANPNQPLTTSIDVNFGRSGNGSYADSYYDKRNYSSTCNDITWIGTPAPTSVQHFVRITITANYTNGTVWVKSFSGRVSSSNGVITRSGFYADGSVPWGPGSQIDSQCPGGTLHNYTRHSTLGAIACPSTLCKTVTPPNNATSITVKRTLDTMCGGADVTMNGVVDLLDRREIVRLTGVSIGPDGNGDYDINYNPRADADGDGTIDGDDLSVFDDANCTADTDGSGTLTIADIQLFVNWFNAHDLRADMDADGQFTIFDSQAYTNLYNAGCP